MDGTDVDADFTAVCHSTPLLHLKSCNSEFMTVNSVERRSKRWNFPLDRIHICTS